MTPEQIQALKALIDAKIAYEMVPVFANEMVLRNTEEAFDRIMASVPHDGQKGI